MAVSSATRLITCLGLLAAGVILACGTSCGQDLKAEAKAAQQRLRQQQLQQSAKRVAALLERKQLSQSPSLISALFGQQFNDELVLPLIQRTDDPCSAAERSLLWHAIAYTQTSAGRQFLHGRRQRGDKAERLLADACLAAAELRRIGMQCDLSPTGQVDKVFSSPVNRDLTATDVAWIARLPALKTLSVRFAKGAMDPLRRTTSVEYADVGCESAYIDEAIQCLSGCRRLGVLNLYGPVSDAALPTIGNFKELTCLRLSGMRVTDHGLQHLRGLAKLTMLELNDTAITDAGLEHLRPLKELKHLSLSGTGVNGQGLPHLQEMHNLWALHLENTPIDDRALGSFAEFPALGGVHFLYLGKTKITDAGLSHLRGLPSIEGLTLGGNEAITSQGVLKLAGLRGLKWLTCPGGRVSHRAAAQFAAGRPESFYLAYTNKPDGAICYEKGAPQPDNSQYAGLIKQFRRAASQGRVSPALLDRLTAEGRQIIGPLLQAVKQQHGVYAGVGQVLHRLGPDVLDELIEELREDSAYQSRSAITYALKLHGRQQLPRLRRMLKDDSAAVRQAASDALLSIASQAGQELPEEMHAELLQAVRDMNSEVRTNAAHLLGKFPDQAAATAAELKKMLRSDPVINARLAAIAGLGQATAGLSAKDAIRSSFIDALVVAIEKDDSFYIREAAVYHLAKQAKQAASGDDRALRALVRATADPWHGVRGKAAAALQKLGHPLPAAAAQRAKP